MKIINKKDFLKTCIPALEEIFESLTNFSPLYISNLEVNRTVLVIVDMINGFTREGPLRSPYIELLIPEILEVQKVCNKLGIATIAFADNHDPNSPEFETYPAHCILGTSEAEIVDEIKEVGKLGKYTLIAKNSTNAFLEDKFQEWLMIKQEINTFLITGDCSDICIEQLATTLKAWFNKQNKKSRIIVPLNAIDTYDFGLHNRDLMNILALYNMQKNGVEIVTRLL
ncbi:MAG: cysteine hydrolase [Oligoflexia bacterium]|nr:cysteine hydrolase [Oligoflexia bacterium]